MVNMPACQRMSGVEAHLKAKISQACSGISETSEAGKLHMWHFHCKGPVEESSKQLRYLLTRWLTFLRWYSDPNHGVPRGLAE
jgi:hypothetical protein